MIDEREYLDGDRLAMHHLYPELPDPMPVATAYIHRHLPEPTANSQPTRPDPTRPALPQRLVLHPQIQSKRSERAHAIAAQCCIQRSQPKRNVPPRCTVLTEGLMVSEQGE